MKKVLLVDDDMAFLHLLSGILRKYLQIFEAAGVNEALKVIETTNMDAICSDFNMRDGTGFELLKILRERELQIPFIIMSGTEERNMIHTVQCYGAIFCCKTDPDLIATIISAANLNKSC